MKILELLEVLKESDEAERAEPTEWDNDPFRERLAEVGFLYKKLIAIAHQRKIHNLKFRQLAGKGLLTDVKPTDIESKDLEAFVEETPPYKRYFGDGKNPEVRRLIEQNLKFIKIVDLIRSRIKDLTVKGHSFCFTGFRDTEMESKIRQLGGSIVSGVSGKTTYLVAIDPKQESGKQLKAAALGTKVISKAYLNRILNS